MLYYETKNFILIPVGIISIALAFVCLSILPVHSLGMGWQAAPYHDSSFYLHSIAWRLAIIAILFLLLSIATIWQSDLKYHYSFFALASTLIFSFLVLGLLSYYSGLAKTIDTTLGNNRIYAMLLGDRNAAWKHPELGLLSGQIAASQDADTLRLIGFDQRVWLLDISKLSPDSRSRLKTGNDYRLIGRDLGETRFEVETYYAYED